MEGYLPARKIAIAVATTAGEGAFDDQGNYKYSSHFAIFAAIGNHIAPTTPSQLPNHDDRSGGQTFTGC